MKTLCWDGTDDVRVSVVPNPKILCIKVVMKP